MPLNNLPTCYNNRDVMIPEHPTNAASTLRYIPSSIIRQRRPLGRWINPHSSSLLTLPLSTHRDLCSSSKPTPTFVVLWNSKRNCWIETIKSFIEPSLLQKTTQLQVSKMHHNTTMNIPTTSCLPCSRTH